MASADAQPGKDAAPPARPRRARLPRLWAVARRAIIRCQAMLRRRLAYRVLKALRIDARDVSKYRESSYRLERKVMELSQALEQRAEEARRAARDHAAAEERLRGATERLKREQESVMETKRKLAAERAALQAAQAQIEELTERAAASEHRAKAAERRAEEVEEEGKIAMTMELSLMLLHSIAKIDKQE